MRLIEDKTVTVFRKDGTSKNGKTYTMYSLGVSSKDANGNWQNAYLDCKFKKGVEVNNKAKIKIDNCFPTVDSYNGTNKVRWMVTDFEVVEEGEAKQTSSFMDIPDSAIEELPFA